MALSIRQFCQLWWKEVTKKVKKAVVFVDNEIAECLHWHGGLMEMISAGAHTVREFSSFEAGKENEKKAVFIVSSAIYATKKIILQHIIKNSSFEYCVLITSAHPSVHQFAKYGAHRENVSDMSVFHSLEEDMLQWMGNLNFTVEVLYFPLYVMNVTERMFLTPPFRNLFPFTDAEVPRIQELLQMQHKQTDRQLGDTIASVDMASLPLELQVSIHHFVSCFHSLFTTLDFREDIFSLGHYSGLIASELETLPAAVSRRKTASNHCSLILIDRTLDMVSATRYNTDSLLDRILAVLPRLPGHTNDVAVNMSPICNAKQDHVLEDMVIAPGCLAHPSDELCSKVLDWLVNKRQKDILMGLHQHLSLVAPSGAADKSGKMVPRVTPHLLDKQVAGFKGHADEIFQSSGLLQQTLAVTQTLRSPRSSQLDVLVSIEKLLVQSLGATKDGAGILDQVAQLIRTRKERGLLIPDLLALLIYVFSLAGNDVMFPTVEQSQLLGVLGQALQEDKDQLVDVLSVLAPPNGVDFLEVAGQTFASLRHIGSARKELSKYRSLLHNRGSTTPAVYSSLLEQLMADVLDPARPDLPDLMCKSSGLKDLLKTGFSLLLNRPKQQHPLDNPVLIVYIVGGITAMEVKTVQEMVISSGQDTQVIVGGGDKMAAEPELSFVPTKCASLVKPKTDFQVVVHKTNNKSTENRHIAKQTNNGDSGKAGKTEMDMKKVRFEVFKFAMSGLSSDKKEEAKVALAIKLGAKPPKRKGYNYKEYKLMKQKEAEESQQQEKLLSAGKTKSGKADVKTKRNKRHAKKGQPKKSGILDPYGKVGKDRIKAKRTRR